MVKRRQQSPHTNVAQGRVMVSTPHVGSACPTLRGFSLGTLVYPSPQKPTFQTNATVSRQLFYPYKLTWRKKEQEAHTAKCFFYAMSSTSFFNFPQNICDLPHEHVSYEQTHSKRMDEKWIAKPFETECLNR